MASARAPSASASRSTTSPCLHRRGIDPHDLGPAGLRGCDEDGGLGETVARAPAIGSAPLSANAAVKAGPVRTRTGSAPLSHTLTDERSSAARCPRASSARRRARRRSWARRCGCPGNGAIARSQQAGSRMKASGGRITDVLPVPTAARAPRTRPMSWLSGIQMTVTDDSSMPRWSAPASMFATRQSWVMTTPFGSLVDPDVYWR